MRSRLNHGSAWCVLLVLSSVSACAEDPARDGVTGPSVAINVAPLNLPGVTDARYTLTIRNGLDEVIVDRQLDAVTFGNGAGSLAFVAPCDADASANTVTLTLLELYQGDPAALIDPGTYQNPGAITKPFTCVANTDVRVDFDVAILRQANQGFFDTAVSFDDVFCSAKLDCADDAGQPLNLLFDDGVRSTTIVSGLACTGGIGGETTLYRDDLVLDCPGTGTVTTDPSEGPGNLAVDAGIVGDAGIVFGAATYFGEEQLGLSKRYWNVAIGLEPGVANCTLTTTATAASQQFDALTTPLGSVWPVIDVNVNVTDGAGVLACSQHPVNGSGPNAGVATQYTSATEPATFDNAYPAFEVTFPSSGPVDPASLVTSSGTLMQTPTGIVVVYSDTTIPTSPEMIVARYENDAWDNQPVLTGANATRDTVLIDDSGVIHVVYGLPAPDANLYYANNSSGSFVAEIIPGVPEGTPALDLDANGIVHVTSASHVNPPGRFHAERGAMGGWTTTNISTSNTSIAIIVANGPAEPAIFYNRWSGGTTRFAERSGASFTDTLINNYSPDQGPPLSMVWDVDDFVIAYGVFPGSYGSSHLRVESRNAGSWARETLGTGLSPISSVDLIIAPTGERYVTTCDSAKNVRVYTDRNGPWQSTNIGRCRPSQVDSLIVDDTLYVTFSAETTETLEMVVTDVTTL